MRRLFIQFYLLLIGCFGLAILLIGLVYQVSAERAGDRYLEHMMQGSLGLLTGELARLPPARWPVRMGEQSQQLNLPLQLGALANQPLAREDQAFLEAGNIVIVEEDDTFLQRIPGTDQVLIVGPVPYLSYLHELHWVDVGLLLLIGLSLGLPILLWLRPHWRGLQQLEQTARRVGDGDLSSRTGLPPGSSLGRVGRTFDQMTEQLQAMLASRKQLTDAIAHELRTPVSNLMTHTEVVLSKKRDINAYEENLYSNLEELKRMSRMIDDMLFLAKADNGLIIPEQARIELADVVFKLFDYYHLLAEERGIELSLTGKGQVLGDRLMLDRALSNLLSNALRYTPAGQTISVLIRETEDSTTFSIENPGDTISSEHLEKLFDRFYRVDPARREGSPSNAGLGLAITRSIIEAHKGRIWCTSAASLTGFHIELPHPR